MDFEETYIKGLYIIKPVLYNDSRGSFFRSFCEIEFQNINFNSKWVQTNQSINLQMGTVRGLHYQREPFQEDKLVQCIHGSIFDVVVDLRMTSKTFLKAFTIELNDLNNYSILIPRGCAHGFQTMKDHTRVLYYHSQFYTPSSESGFNYSSPFLSIKWPLDIKNISEKDNNLPILDLSFKGL